MIDIRELNENFKNFDGKEITIGGWVLSNRDSKNIGFISFTDGTHFTPIQVIYKDDSSDFATWAKITTGSGLRVVGTLKCTPDAKQPFEVIAKEIEIMGEAISEYPLQKKRHTVEYLREIAHLRPRTNLFRATFAVRSELAFAVNKFYQEKGFQLVHTPILTTNDGEGAGEAFLVTTPEDKKNDFTSFFNKKASLGVTGQLQAEAFAQAFKKVYTFGPTFRAEQSNTSRHAAEFWMIEPEVAFNKLPDNMDLIEATVKYVTKHVMENCKAELEFFNKFVDETLLDRLNNVVNSDFKRLSYTEAIEILSKAVSNKDGKVFENSKIEWGMDLGSEHERYISEEVVKGPVFLYNYPAAIKAFYMALNEDNKTVAACDLLVPGIGELVGGSQRENRYDVLVEKCKQFNIPQEDMQWYLDLRRFGGVVSSGFGIGFERLIMFVTGVKNIRDTIPFPRAYRMLDF